MASAFPNTIKTFTTKVNGVDDVDATHINSVQEEITAMETELIAGHREGWIPASGTWTYASATTFTVAGNLTAYFGVGTKIRLTQGGGYKYFYVVSSSYSAPNTTVTVVADGANTLASAGIANNYFSYADCPVGFPAWFNWTPSWTGLTAVGAVTTAGIFNIVGRMVKFKATVTAATSTAATAVTTYIGNPPISPIGYDVVLATDTNVSTIGTSLSAPNRLYVPTWSARAGFVILSGTYQI